MKKHCKKTFQHWLFIAKTERWDEIKNFNSKLLFSAYTNYSYSKILILIAMASWHNYIQCLVEKIILIPNHKKFCEQYQYVNTTAFEWAYRYLIWMLHNHNQVVTSYLNHQRRREQVKHPNLEKINVAGYAL